MLIIDVLISGLTIPTSLPCLVLMFAMSLQIVGFCFLVCLVIFFFLTARHDV